MNSETLIKTTRPIKITECRSLKMKSVGWSVLTDYYLESVKVYKYKEKLKCAALLKVSDKSGDVTLRIDGKNVANLFEVSSDKWHSIISLANTTKNPSGELFYRNFKLGINKQFDLRQKLFYYFCSSNLPRVLFVTFTRCKNIRTGESMTPFLDIIDVFTNKHTLLHLYQLETPKVIVEKEFEDKKQSNLNNSMK